ncbi:alpha/beta hydrolase (plasmid) [Phyllobacterium sp. 628]|uniref:alpha/beta fold hydrolase n=1 Tax=Phyllobacterium sp. 628 TaxID=2718938 RepID=UPI00166269DC|nr:alpha/beta fold hydrolase [Phyllobacterium sp. 628]QND50514.1 alpha/beta hydrolase [Phyllobacterium sp. 628]
MNKEIVIGREKFAPSEPAYGRAAAQPVVFGATVGLFQDADSGAGGNAAVLFASPWGLEELCTRKFWRIISEKLAAEGIPSFRFDWPGTGDGLDGGDFSSGFTVWSDALVAGAELLQNLSGRQRIIVLSQGMGSTIAAEAAARIDGLEAIGFMAPVVSGRHYIRELSIWSGMVDADLGLDETQRDKSGVSIASLKLPAEIGEGLRRSNLMTLDSKLVPECLVLARTDRPADKEFASHLAQFGGAVTTEDYTGYDKLVSNPVISQLPLDIADRVTDWVASVASRLPMAENKGFVAPIQGGHLQGDGFRDTPLRFGKGQRLYGVMCEPLIQKQGATILFLTSAYDRHAGWGRSIVHISRELARRGIASLRFDSANASDSPPVPGAPDQVLYHTAQNADVAEALEFLKMREAAVPVVVAGRCSGAYLGFQNAAAEPGLAGAVLVNPITFYWEPGRSVDEAVREGNRTLEDYGSRLLRASTFRRLVRGELDFPGIARNVAGGIGRRIRGLARRLLRHRTTEGKAVYKAFAALKDRNVPVQLLYSYRDPGLEYFDFYFDEKDGKVSGYPNVSVEKIADADHNLTPEHARKAYIDALEQMARRFPV